MTPYQRERWFPVGQTLRSKEEQALGRDMWSMLDRIRSGIHPMYATKIDAEEQLHLMATYFPLPHTAIKTIDS